MITIRRTLTILSALLISMAAASHDIAVTNSGVTIYYTFTNNSTELAVSYRGSSDSEFSNEYTGKVVIPSTVTYSGKTYPVTSIGSSAFSGCSGLTSITIPNSVTSIEGRAFYGCSSLTSITIPNSVTSIGSSVFSSCSNLTSVTIPSSVTSIGSDAFFGTAWYNNQPDGLVYAGEVLYNYKGTMPENTIIDIKEGTVGIADYAFYIRSGLTSVNVPNSVTSIGYNAFYGTGWYYNQPDGLVYAGKVLYVYKGTMPENTSIDIKEGTLGIAGSAFSGCSGLTSITIPNSVISIGNSAFYYCSGLTSIAIPNSVTSIGNEAFACCSGLTSFKVESDNTVYDSRNDCNAIIKTAANELIAGCQNTVIPNSVTSIGIDAFYGCKSLTSITIPNSVTSIGSSALSGCSGLTSITIPNSVTSIEGRAFSGCSGLTSVTIPNSVISIGSGTFGGCTKMTDMYCYSSQLPTTEGDIFYAQGSAYIQNATLHVPASALEDYMNTAPWSGFGTIVPIDEEDEDDLQNYLDSFTDTEDKLTATTYTRQFKNTEWQSLYVPFTLSYSDWSSRFEVAKLTGTSGSADQLQLEATIMTADDGDLQANYPYLIRAKKVGTYTLEVGASRMTSQEIKTIQYGGGDLGLSVKGNYSALQGLKQSKRYCMLGGSLWIPNSDSYVLQSFRWSAITASSHLVIKRASHPITLWINDGVTSVERLPMTADEDGSIGHRTVYDLTGRRVSVSENARLSSLPKGLYIIDGKKYTVK